MSSRRAGGCSTLDWRDTLNGGTWLERSTSSEGLDGRPYSSLSSFSISESLPRLKCCSNFTIYGAFSGELIVRISVTLRN